MKDSTGMIFAAKTVAKASLKTSKTKQKLIGEINIHKVMKHPNIVGFIDCFEDAVNVYILLEVCSNGSLMSMLRARKFITEPECKFFLTQIIGGVTYMHEYGVIHRDLKLGNIFLDDKMNVKIGDFGLAAVIATEGERKKTICGTPNYIAPEVLFGKKEGHSFEVDVWSVGIILYAMIMGKPPFQSKDVDTIYRKIKNNEYHYPHDNISPEARHLISKFLQPDPNVRIKMEDALKHEFFSTEFPDHISKISLTQAPEPIHISPQDSEINFINCKVNSRLMLRPPSSTAPSALRDITKVYEDVNEQNVLPSSISPSSTKDKYKMVMVPKDENELNQQHIGRAEKYSNEKIAKLFMAKHPLGEPRRVVQHENENYSGTLKNSYDTNGRVSRPSTSSHSNDMTQRSIDPSIMECAIPPSQSDCISSVNEVISRCISKLEGGWRRPYYSPGYQPQAVYISRWVDYSHRYGIAYELSNSMVGIAFTDKTVVQMNPTLETFYNIDFNPKVRRWSSQKISSSTKLISIYGQKIGWVTSMRSYMNKHLRNGVPEDNFCVRPGSSSYRRSSSMTFLVNFDRLVDVNMFLLSNGSIQLNFPDHSKFIISADSNTIGFIDSQYHLHCWSISTGETCCSSFARKFTKEFLNNLAQKLSEVQGNLVSILH